MSGDAGDVELGLQLLAPLPHQRRRRQHQHALDHAAQQVFLEHHAGLDSLAEPDFVRQQYAAAELFQHLAHGLDLMAEGFDPMQMGQAQQLVEALRQAEMGEALAQPVPSAVGFRCSLRGGLQRREVELHRQRNVDSNVGQTGGRGRRLDCGGRCGRQCPERTESQGLIQPGQIVALKYPQRGAKPALLRHGQRVQQMVGLPGYIALGVALEVGQRPLGTVAQ